MIYRENNHIEGKWLCSSIRYCWFINRSASIAAPKPGADVIPPVIAPDNRVQFSQGKHSVLTRIQIEQIKLLQVLKQLLS